MFELLAMSILGIAYINALSNEAKEEANLKEKERIQNLKIKVFCYSVRHHLLYDDVVKKLQNNELSFEELNKWIKRILL